MGFKEMVAADNGSVFLDTEYLAKNGISRLTGIPIARLNA